MDSRSFLFCLLDKADADIQMPGQDNELPIASVRALYGISRYCFVEVHFPFKDIALSIRENESKNAMAPKQRSFRSHGPLPASKDSAPLEKLDMRTKVAAWV